LESLSRGRQQIVITSVPYGANKATLVESIAELIVSRKLPQVLDVRDESTNDVRVVLEPKSGTAPELIMAYLYKHTDLAANFNVNLTCLVPTANPLVGQPARLSLRELCRHFLDFRLQVVTRRLSHEKRKLEERLHLLDGFALLHGDLDRAIRIIRSAESREDAAGKLQAAFRLDEVQVQAILEIRLYQLARLEIGKIQKERKEKRERLSEVEDLLKKPKRRWQIIRDELARAKKDYSDARRTAISRAEELAYDPEAYIVHEEATVLFSRDGWVKRVREIKDPSTTRLREGDGLFRVLAGTTRDRIAVFSSFGGLYVLPVSTLPSTTGYGEPIQSMAKFADNERVVDVVLVPGSSGPSEQGTLFDRSSAPAQLLLATARGFGFRLVPDLSETTRAGRKIARTAKGDEVMSISPVRGGEVIVAAARGKMLRFPLGEVPELSGAGKGVYLMRPGEAGDRVVGAVSPPADGRIVVVTADGGERRIHPTEVPAGRRGGKGQKVVKRGIVAAVRLEG
jgi:DNA gyrase subunit A